MQIAIYSTFEGDISCRSALKPQNLGDLISLKWNFWEVSIFNFKVFSISIFNAKLFGHCLELPVCYRNIKNTGSQISGPKCTPDEWVVFRWVFRKRYSGYSKKHSISKNRWHIYFTECFFTETIHLPKTIMLKKLFKTFCSQTVTSDLPQTGISQIKGPQEKKKFTDALENTFLHKVDTYLKFPFQKPFFKMHGC